MTLDLEGVAALPDKIKLSGPRTSVYRDVINRFLATNEQYALVNTDNKQSAYVNLIRAINNDERLKGTVRCIKRQGKIYLERLAK